ncbi:hypothetical protein K2V69_13475 [Staphylococcus gallinarum]|uniref:hypothetical protein n=1 Tax=Staphylococcus gallinarum TaxID=1293 RepID=UPI001E33366B|nr:hypothetical protein [Staphylococcus gallinarum]MCD8921684.1 hypothetical protein [Staphylococcus gallinarum]
MYVVMVNKQSFVNVESSRATFAASHYGPMDDYFLTTKMTEATFFESYEDAKVLADKLLSYVVRVDKQ